MQQFTGYAYLLVDVANNFGLDKETFETRMDWVNSNMDNLEALATDAENFEQYVKAVLALRRAQQHQAIGHFVTLDATCSGLQIMSAATGCKAGAEATGLVDPTKPADAYTTITNKINELLHVQGLSVDVARASAKKAVMVTIYGGQIEPQNIFGGEDTPEYQAFMEACHIVAPGAMELLQILVDSWKPFALEHKWTLPDGFEALVRVMSEVTTRVEVDELDHSTFTFVYKENKGTKFGVSNAANVVHSIDAYILRSVIRRCNYNPAVVLNAQALIEIELLERLGGKRQNFNGTNKYVELYRKTKMADVVILPHLTKELVGLMDNSHLKELNRIICTMLTYKPFPIVTVHDA